MAVEYINRKGDTYYLHERKTKKGNPAYSFSKAGDGVLVESIPDGYEIYENPHSQVFLRKIQPKVITDKEASIVEKGAKRYSKIENLIVDVKKNTIVVFIPDRSFDEFEGMLSRFPRIPGSAELREMWAKTSTYLPMMRFVLIDKKSREFAVERWCFLGSIDDWSFVDSSSELAELVKEYTGHLGQDSFYEL